MKLGFDSSILSLGQYHPRFRTGIYRVIVNIAAELKSRANVTFHSQFQYLEHWGKIISRNEKKFSVPLWKKVLDRGAREAALLLSGGTKKHVQRLEKQEAILLPTLTIDPILFNQVQVPVVLIVYDLIALKFPEWVSRGNLRNLEYWQKLRQTRFQFACISEHTRKDLIEMLQIPEEQTFVAHLAPDPIFQTPLPLHPETLESYGLQRDQFFLSVGTLEVRKNLPSVLRAFAEYVAQTGDKTTKLALVGGSGWNNEAFSREFANSPVRDRIVWLGFVSDEVLCDLYQSAKAFLFLSHYEGFGLPILEAMSLGCPVISSNTSSMPEVGGNAVLYTAPTDIKTTTNQLINISHDAQLREKLKTTGKQQAAKFSWTQCADTLLKHLK